ncbi:Protein of unknown function (DUF3071) [Mumia flava]|uniref:DUF3071 domain-containing protein n=1 Tax=Mumia flava TaxID=1348852 RepID=A0A2M9B6T8_9ACTN|nr:septation protein SepH [Mumia flava]PJJ53663.1 Protein of unknown function (DUF3071) [Mumia flava]
MRDLTVVGLSEDQRYVILRGAVGEQYRVPADDRLRATLRNDRARLGQLEIAMDSALRPRDIQARIRRGESPDDVAAAAELPVERIMAYAYPVLAEREHMAERARGATVRRKHAQSNALTLGEAVDSSVRSRGSDPESADWDSYRRDDGRWTVTVEADGLRGSYVFDPAGRYTFAEDDAARELVGDVPSESEMAIADAVSRPEQAVVNGGPDARVASLRQARERRAAAVADEPFGVGGAPAEEPRTSASGRGDAPERARAERDAGTRESDGDQLSLQDLAGPSEEEPTLELGEPGRSAARGAAQDPPGRPAGEADQAEGESDEAGEAPPRKRSPRRKERRRVPSWDEIMFGDKA